MSRAVWHGVLVLVCVPGLGLDEAAWHPTRSGLAGRASEVATLPGFGRRPRPGDDVDPVSLGSQLASERLAGRSGLVLAGHSASCQVVAEAALAAPAAVVGLVLVGPTTDLAAGSWSGLVGRWLRTAVHESPLQVPTLVRSYTRTGLRQMLRTMDAARRHDVRQPLSAGGLPILVVRGRRDRICPPGWAGELVGSAPAGSRSQSLPRGAHMVPLTHGDLTARAIAAFLDSLTRPSP